MRYEYQVIYNAKINDVIDLLHAAKNREHVAKNRTHAADILRGTWPTTVERSTTADSVFNLVTASIVFQRMVPKLACTL